MSGPERCGWFDSLTFFQAAAGGIARVLSSDSKFIYEGAIACHMRRNS